MKRAIIEFVVALAVLVLIPAAVLAQDDMMSFSEDEVAEEAPAEDDGTMSFGIDEAEAPVEEEPAAEEPGDEGTSESDILGALGDSSGEMAAALGTEEAPAAEAGAEQAGAGEPTHPIWAVQQVYALRAGRVDLQPSFGISMNDPYVQHQAISLGAAYYITEVLAAGVSFNFYRWLDATTDLNFSVSRATHQTVPINEYFWGGQINFTYVPMYGKFAFFEEWILHWDVWVLGGGGFIFTRPIPVIDPEYRTFDFTMKFSFNVGIGGRLYLARFLAIYLELRDYIFPEELENLETFSTEEDREDDSQWLDDDFKLTNNVMMHVGVSLFFPFTFEYELPK